MDNYSARKDLYKSRGGTSWRETYRKKCFDRLRARRTSLIDQFRTASLSDNEKRSLCDSPPLKLASDVMQIEWEALHSDRRFPSLSRCDDSFPSGHEEEEELNRILLEIQRELVNEDENMLNEMLHFDHLDLRSRIRLLEDEELLCPVCQVNNLQLTSSGGFVNTFLTPGKKGPAVAGECDLFHCRCGLTFPKGSLTIAQIRSTLSRTLEEHEAGGCRNKLNFSATDNRSDDVNILVTCSRCDWLSILL